MVRIKCDANPDTLNNLPESEIGVLLYGTRTNAPGGAALGSQIRNVIKRLAIPISQRAFDFLTVSLAVTAADTFVKRESTADGWTREFELVVAVADPDAWVPLRIHLETALRFLSGDVWHLDIQGGGPCVPTPYPKYGRARIIPVNGRDCVSLYSGGLDSSIAALDILSQGRNPILVSHSYRGDKAVQDDVSNCFPRTLSRFSSNLNPTFYLPAEPSMRTRSLNFLAFGAVVASAISVSSENQQVDLLIPENGLISLNAPLTPRRLGSLSTRTTHPYFLSLIQELFNGLEIPAVIKNPYKFQTKGEMFTNCADQANLDRLATMTVSCGKWKRTNKQCGRCVPCLIRRASFHAAGISDTTPYRRIDLKSVYADENERDDLLALMLAVHKAKQRNNSSWLSLGGPLPAPLEERAQYVEVFIRGLQEVGSYLESQGLL
ncbi:MAG: hypothetical protein PHF56_14815 [Desulfuromonadaceae bacterium]|nr:hypothetical protein [Desulfuromonadaceae bacterium]